ncbi:capsule biosynthesis GfcC family protein [Shewanella sp. OMA3-2]|uniref:capsule biosynthesis GfcC family protein n=1 Tax=Shewanella sp. OMA3-2 TaxID=2908650 RepID=UPI001F484E6C|nr:capsule biosynthesis GfcC family protein [Shewanella sp. OMA3-2]UJF22343.1 capsule biosynthesis GfcC family protein [Shewanella sp. OMA3-2]
MKSFIQLCLVFVVAFSQNINASTSITVKQSITAQESLTLLYEQSPRLVQVIQDSLLNSDQLAIKQQPKAIYWLSAGLYDSKTAVQFQQKQQKILNSLKTQYADMGHPQNISALKTLSSWVHKSHFIKREFIPLDFDTIRLKKALNPLLAGKYLLTLPTKPDYVLVLGAVEKNGPLPFKANQQATAYIDLAMPINDSENSFAWLIQPDGKVERYPIAYWNQHHIDIAPGAIIYLNFQGVRDNEPELNSAILELLRHWVR